MYFDWHRDFEKIITPNCACYTLLVSINKAKKGGETQVKIDDTEIITWDSEMKSAFLFRSNLLHKGVNIDDGIKELLVFDVLFIKNFKNNNQILNIKPNNSNNIYSINSNLLRIINGDNLIQNMDKYYKDYINISFSESRIKLFIDFINGNIIEDCNMEFLSEIIDYIFGFTNNTTKPINSELTWNLLYLFNNNNSNLWIDENQETNIDIIRNFFDNNINIFEFRFLIIEDQNGLNEISTIFLNGTVPFVMNRKMYSYFYHNIKTWYNNKIDLDYTNIDYISEMKEYLIPSISNGIKCKNCYILTLDEIKLLIYHIKNGNIIYDEIISLFSNILNTNMYNDTCEDTMIYSDIILNNNMIDKYNIISNYIVNLINKDNHYLYMASEYFNLEKETYEEEEDECNDGDSSRGISYSYSSYENYIGKFISCFSNLN